MRLALVFILMLLLLQIAEGAEYYNGIINTSQILTNISQGSPVKYDHIIVKGNLSLESLKDLPTEDVWTGFESLFGGDKFVKIVTSPIRINDSIIEGNMNFKNILFENSTNFIGTKFNSNADFEDSYFNRSANFSGSAFNSTADFRHSYFNSLADFKNSKFSSADFSRSIFNITANFRNSIFFNSADFTEATFNSADFTDSIFNNADFWHSYFNTAGFNYSNFIGGVNFGTAMFVAADFEDSYFSGSAVFSRSIFNNADFRHSHFNDNAYFDTSNFMDNADFSDSNFNSTAGFSDSNFNSTANFGNSKFNSFEFMNSKINNADFKGSIFNSVADFSGSMFNSFVDFSKTEFKAEAYFLNSKFKDYPNFNNLDKIYIYSKDISSLLIDTRNLSLYSNFINHYKKINWYQDANEMYYQYRKELRILMPMDKFSEIIDLLAEESYGYGVKPLYPLAWSILFICLFSIFFIEAFNNDLIKALRFSISVFLSGTKFFVDPPDIPAMPYVSPYMKKYRSRLKFAFNAERVLGAIFQGLIILSITKSIINLEL